MSGLWRSYSLSLTLGILWLTSWLVQTVAGWLEHSQEPTPDYLWVWLRTTTENSSSEFLQLLTFVVLTSFLIHRGSHESKDSDDEIRRQLRRIEDRLEGLWRHRQ